jgi:hypothetical protein
MGFPERMLESNRNRYSETHVAANANRVASLSVDEAENPAPAQGPVLAASVPGDQVPMTRHPVDGDEPACARGPSCAAAKGERSRSRRTGVRLGRLVLGGIVLVALWACGPVYIPVPPPGQISFVAEPLIDSTGATRTWWITSGGKNGNAADATFFVVDQERAAGVITHARPDGSFTADPMEGAVGDHVTVYYRDVTGRDSAAACVLLSEASVADSCP